MGLFVGIEPGETRTAKFDSAPREIKMAIDVLGASVALLGKHVVLGPKSLVFWKDGHFGTFHGIYNAAKVAERGFEGAVPLRIGTDVPGCSAWGKDRARFVLAGVLTLHPDQPLGFLTTTLPWGGGWRFQVYRVGSAGAPELGYDGLASDYLLASRVLASEYVRAAP